MSSDLSLYGITEELKKLDLMFEESQGEVTEDMELLEAEVTDLLISKVDSCVGYRRRELDLIELAKQRIKELQAFVKTKDNKVNRFDTYVIDCMKKLDKKELNGALHSIKTRKPSKAVNIINEDLIPVTFLTVIPASTSINKAEISKAIKSGEEVPGAELIDGKIGLNIK